MDKSDDVLVSPWVMCLSNKRTKKGKQALVMCHDRDLQLLFFGRDSMQDAGSSEQTTCPGFVIDKELTHAVDHRRGPMYGEPLFSCEPTARKQPRHSACMTNGIAAASCRRSTMGPSTCPSPATDEHAPDNLCWHHATDSREPQTDDSWQ